MKASSTTTGLVATAGRAAIAARSAARTNCVAESMSQSALKELAKNGGRLALATAAAARLNAAACINPPAARINEEKAKKYLVMPRIIGCPTHPAYDRAP